MVEMPMIAKGAEELYLLPGMTKSARARGGGYWDGKDGYAAGYGGGAEFDWGAGVCGGCEGRPVGNIAGGEEFA